MNGFMPVSALWRTFQETFHRMRDARFFRDRLSSGLLVGSLLVNGANLIWLSLHVRPTEAPVPVRFSSLTLFDALGPWYFPFLIALLALVITLINGVFAYQSFARSRLASFFLLIGCGVVAIFAFIISTAFGAVR